MKYDNQGYEAEEPPTYLEASSVAAAATTTANEDLEATAVADSTTAAIAISNIPTLHVEPPASPPQSLPPAYEEQPQQETIGAEAASACQIQQVQVDVHPEKIEEE